MASKSIYQDDKTLTNFLDGLISSAQEDKAPDIALGMDFSRGKVETAFSPRHLREGISTANELLRQGGQCAALPTLDRNSENIQDVLAAAVTAIVRLSRCCKANVNLREEAERNTQAAQIHIEDLSRLLRGAKDKVHKKTSALAALRSSMAEAEIKHKTRVRQLASECTSLKARLTGAAQRESQLKVEATQRERQFSLLQKRVHSLLASSKKLSIEPVVTGSTETLSLPRARYDAFGNYGSEIAPSDYTAIDEDGGNGPFAIVLEENYFMRSTVRAVHVELDDFFERYPKAFPAVRLAEKPEDACEHQEDAESEYEDEDGAEEEEFDEGKDHGGAIKKGGEMGEGDEDKGGGTAPIAEGDGQKAETYENADCGEGRAESEEGRAESEEDRVESDEDRVEGDHQILKGSGEKNADGGVAVPDGQTGQVGASIDEESAHENPAEVTRLNKEIRCENNEVGQEPKYDRALDSTVGEGHGALKNAAGEDGVAVSNAASENDGILGNAATEDGSIDSAASEDGGIHNKTVGEGGGDSEEGDKREVEDEELNVLAPAPNEERMLLPLEMIQEEFEENLERKLNAIRIALAGIQ